MRITLYTTAGCHLCEQAAELIQQAQAISEIDLNEVEIGDDDALMDEYGVRIPVLGFEDGSELNWPFDFGDLQQKLLLGT